MKKHLLIIMMSVSFVLILSALVIAADNPFVGTWKMNPAKSRISQGSLDKSSTWKSEAQENGQIDTFNGIDADGKAFHTQAAPKYDGNDYPIKGSTDLSSVAIKKIDANTIEYIVRKSGKESSKGRMTLSKDGKTVTEVGKSPNAKGPEITYTIIWEKQ